VRAVGYGLLFRIGKAAYPGRDMPLFGLYGGMGGGGGTLLLLALIKLMSSSI
jgi:hypothetical protein